MLLNRRWSQKKPSGKEDRRPSSNSDQTHATAIERETTSSPIRRSNTQRSKASIDSSSTVVQAGVKLIEIKCRDDINSVKFLDAGKCVVSGGQDYKIRQWQVEDGTSVGKPISAGSVVRDIGVSPDGNWIVCGGWGGLVTVWKAMTHEKVTEFAAHSDWVHVVDVSPDATRIATGSNDKTACVSSLSTDRRLLGRLVHDNRVIAVKFSPDGHLIATATWKCSSVRVYGQNGHILVDFPLEVVLNDNQSLAWTSDGRQLFALAFGGAIHCLDVSTGTTTLRWDGSFNCIALARGGTFIAASVDSSVLFWDTGTHKQIGSVIQHAAKINCMAISSNYDIATGVGKTITLQSLYDIIPPSYFDDIQCKQEIQYVKVEESDLEEYESPQEENSSCKIVCLEKTVEELRDELAKFQHAAGAHKDRLCEIIKLLYSGLDVQALSDSQHTVDQNQGSLDTAIDSLPAVVRARDEYSNNKISHLERTNQNLRVQLTESQKKSSESNEKIAGLDKAIHTLYDQLERSSRESADLRACDEKSSGRIAYLNQTNEELRVQLADAERKASSLIRAHELRHQCEFLYAQGRVHDAAGSFLEMMNTATEDVKANKSFYNWLPVFAHQCITSLERIGDEASNAGKQDEAVTAYSTALSLGPLNPRTVLTKWTNMVLVLGSTHEALIVAAKFKVPRFLTYRAVCDILEGDNRLTEAVECFRQMQNELLDDTGGHDDRMQWELDFRKRYVEKLEKLGDTAKDAKKHAEAIGYYSSVLSLDPADFNGRLLLTRDAVLVKWTSVMLVHGSAHEALNAAAEFKVPRFPIYRAVCDTLEADGCLTEAVECFRQMQHELSDDADTHDGRTQWELDFRGRCIGRLEKLGDTARDSKKHDEAIGYYSSALSLDPTTSNDILLKRSLEVIELDPSSHKGYEGKHAALHSMGRYGEAFEAFKMMLLVLKHSPEPRLRDLRHRYVDATATIKKAVEQTIRHIPHVLIDTVTGRLYDKTRQAVAFEELPIYDELRSSMTTQLDRPRIRSEVKKFYSYVMLSHRWQPNEPTFQMVENTNIYGLPASPANDKVQRFCELVRSLRFRWAWSDTCCVNQLDKGIQQESLVAMFRWYRGSSLTVVHLLGVFSDSQEIDCLWKSIWNTRGWTYQEYVASDVVQFYTEDWKPYLGLDMFNHKESPIILQEMERAMKFTAQELATLQPGLDKTREKLYLASMRQTTREEDIAYSLFGIFNVALPVIYGEGHQAIGRLLEHILTRSDNVTLLAWTGNSGSHHSYLPTDLAVYNEIVPPHVPPPVETTEMDNMITTLQSSSSFDHSVAIALYDQLYVLPPLSLVAGRLRLPGIVFPLSIPVESDPESNLPVYHATSPMLGEVEIRTAEKLSGVRGLLLIHPWISPLLDYDFLCGAPLFDHATRALRLVVRLRQPFGALLLAPLGRVQCKRVATDSLIMVRVHEETLLSELMDGIRTIDIQ